MKIKTLLLLLLPIAGLTSCASIVSKSNYPVTFISSQPTTVEVKSEKTGQVVHKAKTPTTATLSASHGFFKPATYSVSTPSSQQTLSADMDPWYAGNILFGGFIGAIVDPATGNMWKLQKEVHVGSAQ